jgi:hypothetical protein
MSRLRGITVINVPEKHHGKNVNDVVYNYL